MFFDHRFLTRRQKGTEASRDWKCLCPRGFGLSVSSMFSIKDFSLPKAVPVTNCTNHERQGVRSLRKRSKLNLTWCDGSASSFGVNVAWYRLINLKESKITNNFMVQDLQSVDF